MAVLSEVDDISALKGEQKAALMGFPSGKDALTLLLAFFGKSIVNKEVHNGEAQGGDVRLSR